MIVLCILLKQSLGEPQNMCIAYFIYTSHTSYVICDRRVLGIFQVATIYNIENTAKCML